MTVLPAYRVRAEWDGEARVWTATSEDVPGLCAEAATLDGLAEAVAELAPALLVANGVLAPGEARDGVPIRLSAERDLLARAAPAAA